ncbi:hypothetical protein ACQKMW_18250 [Pseudomonas sivasensis]|uniref:hypothetical protein n=1 Tax=Pseudomonas sivasensis TaxID=1880678 RepID=UPI003D03E962
MNQPFEIGDREVHITGAVIIDAGRFADIGIGLPEGLSDESQDKADLIERRLSRIEAALGLTSTDESVARLRSAIDKL